MRYQLSIKTLPVSSPGRVGTSSPGSEAVLPFIQNMCSRLFSGFAVCLVLIPRAPIGSNLFSARFSAHKAVLASASDLLFQLLTMPIVDDNCGHCSSNDSLVRRVSPRGLFS